MKNELEEAITYLHDKINLELISKTEKEVFESWYFTWNNEINTERNLYVFFDMLGLYSRQCRRWEEQVNGSCCVVERVRSKYIMPRIRELIQLLDLDYEQ